MGRGKDSLKGFWEAARSGSHHPWELIRGETPGKAPADSTELGVRGRGGGGELGHPAPSLEPDGH